MEDNKGSNEKKGNTPNNVFDIRSGSAILPLRLRSILKGQYIESKDRDETADGFMCSLEQRLISEAALAMVSVTKKMLNKGMKNEK